MSQRDPKVDPRPGDVLRLFCGSVFFIRAITARSSQLVRFESQETDYRLARKPTKKGSGTIAAHIQWAATAEVIHRAEDEQ